MGTSVNMFHKILEALRMVKPAPEYSEKRRMHAPKIYEALPLVFIPGPLLPSMGIYQSSPQASLFEAGIGKTLWRSGYSEPSWDEPTYDDPDDDDEPDNDYDDDYDDDEQNDDDLNNAMMDDLLFGEW